jgi:MATE family multidrug resistance protein
MSSLSFDIRRVLGLAWPVMISMLSYSLMSAADAIFVGRLGTVPLAAVGLGVTTTFLFLGLPMGLVRGLRVATAQATGAGREHIVRAYGWQAVWLGLAMGVLVALASVAGPLVFRLLGGSAAVQAEALAYFQVKALAAPVVLLGMALTSWFEGRGDTRTPMRVHVTANLGHIALVAVLVEGAGPIPALGIRGAAWAGVIALTLSSLALLRLAWPTLREISARPRRSLLAESARLGLPIGVQRLLDITAWTTLTGVLASVGDAELAAHTLAIRVLMVSFLPGLAIAEATAVLVGQAVGAKEPDVARRACRAGIASALAVMAVGGLAFVLLPDLLMAPFHAGADVVPIARNLLLIAAAFQLVDAVATVLYFALDGAGDTRFTLVSSIVLSWGVKLPVGVVLATVAGLGAVGAWLGLTGELFVLLGVLAWRWRSGRWYAPTTRVLAVAA